ncbi:glycosyltransferase family 2 protein [Mediterraneibacter faecis]|uniref:glycosyltransferase family 2 protein n=1 Tax=Mediterraneibacter faecis TaxID=592978 RepID=UPI0032C1E2EE
MDLISVIIPVYNAEKYLCKCIDSFINQSYKNLELILIDDGSTDSSPEICDEYKLKDKRIKVIHKENEGASEARNIGIKEATANLITFYDSDDFVEEDYIEYLFNLKIKYNTQMSACAYNVCNENGKIQFTIKNKKEESLNKHHFFEKMLNEEGITVSPCFKLYEKKLFENVQFPIGKICEDNGTIYKVVSNVKGNIAYGEKAKCYYVIHNNSVMRSSFTLRKLDMIELTDEMCDYLEKYYSELHDLILRRRIYARFNVLRQMNPSDNETSNIMDELIEYILTNKQFILCNKAVPRRDKIACLLLCINKRVFFNSWEVYRKLKYDK